MVIRLIEEVWVAERECCCARQASPRSTVRCSVSRAWLSGAALVATWVSVLNALCGDIGVVALCGAVRLERRSADFGSSVSFGQPSWLSGRAPPSRLVGQTVICLEVERLIVAA